MTITLEDGVYVGLGEETYFAQDRLGSTDLAKLHRDAASWWYGSRHNPDREESEPGSELSFGKALHLIVLEGEAAYDAGVSVSEFDDFRSKAAREWRDEQIARGKTILTASEDRRVRHMANLILYHPEFREALTEGMSEVSVLFTHDGVPMRARIDKLLPRFLIDLKSYGGHSRGRDAKDKALRIVAERDYDCQRFIYDRAREAMIGFIQGGRIFGADADQRAWLDRLATVDDWSWVWIFFQRRDDRAGKAPVVLPIERPRFDVTFDTGRRKVAAALANYRRYVARFGLAEPWALIEPLWRPNDHDFPSWLGDVADPPSEAETKEAA